MNTISIVAQKRKVNKDVLGLPNNPWGITAAQFVANLPRGPMVVNMDELAMFTRTARKIGSPVALFLGGHAIKVGLTPFIVDLIRSNRITALAVNGSVLIHDYEMAVHGKTSEDVAETLPHGTFGVTEETQTFMYESVMNSAGRVCGLGDAVAGNLAFALKVHGKERTRSILATADEMGIPISAHVALGTDVVHMNPRMNWGLWGIKLKVDFDRVTSVVATLDLGGVAIFIGSCTLLPEVFLKAVAINRNEHGGPHNFTTGVFDLYDQYRLRENVCTRPTKGYYILGPSEINFPIFCAMLKI